MDSPQQQERVVRKDESHLENPMAAASSFNGQAAPVPLNKRAAGIAGISSEHLKSLAFLEFVKSIVPELAKRYVRAGFTAWDKVKARTGMGTGVEPLSYSWGFDRGVPIHRYYVERFLQEFAADIYGHCLEFQDGGYTTKFGGAAVTTLDVLHLDSSNPRATLIADLTKPNELPQDEFDCIVCTHVLHMIPEPKKAVAELYRILKPRGVLLVAVPHICMCDPYQYHDLWRFTPDGLGLLLAKVFTHGSVTLRVYGNSLTAAGEIRGLVSHEFSKTTLDYCDPRFAVEVCARVRKYPEAA